MGSGGYKRQDWLEDETDGRLGYQVFKDSGMIPNEKETVGEHVLDSEGVQDGGHQQGVKKCVQGLSEIADRTGKDIQPAIV